MISKKRSGKRTEIIEIDDDDDIPDEPGCCLYSLCFCGMNGIRSVCSLFYWLFTVLSCMVGTTVICIITFALVARSMGWLDQYDLEKTKQAFHQDL